MVQRSPHAAPSSRLPDERRGRVVGRFCHGCQSVYALFGARHVGKPVAGRDHVASPCAHEGKRFDPQSTWWEPAVEVLAPPPAATPA